VNINASNKNALPVFILYQLQNILSSEYRVETLRLESSLDPEHHS